MCREFLEESVRLSLFLEITIGCEVLEGIVGSYGVRGLKCHQKCVEQEFVVGFF